MKEDYGAIYRQMLQDNPRPWRGKGAGWQMISELAKATKPRTVLDYGSGMGEQYSVHRQHEKWGIPMPTCYDVGVPALAEKPDGFFDAVICTDVMEHIAETDVSAILADIFSYLPPRDDDGETFAFFWISCRPAKKLLPDGRNAHLTVRPGSWWDGKINCFAPRHVKLVARYETEDVVHG